jgi:hypothetical protein
MLRPDPIAFFTPRPQRAVKEVDGVQQIYCDVDDPKDVRSCCLARPHLPEDSEVPDGKAST